MWLVVLIVRDRTPDHVLLNVLAVIEVALIVHLVLGIVRVTGDARDGVSRREYIGYLIGVLLVIPVGVIWSSGERSRGGTAVLLVAVLIVPFMFVRLSDIWAARWLTAQTAETGTRASAGSWSSSTASSRSRPPVAPRCSWRPRRPTRRCPTPLSAVAAVIYIVATFALATNRRRLALVTVGIELVGVLTVGLLTSALEPQDFEDTTVWSDFGAGYGFVPLVLPFVGLWWLWRQGAPGRSDPRVMRDLVANGLGSRVAASSLWDCD